MNPDLVEAVARELAQYVQSEAYDDLPPHRKSVVPRTEFGQADMREIAEAALKAYEEWLAEQGLMVVPRVSGTDPSKVKYLAAQEERT